MQTCSAAGLALYGASRYRQQDTCLQTTEPKGPLLNFNPQALLGFSPASLHFRLHQTGAPTHGRSFSAYRKSTGKYEVSYLDSTLRAQAYAAMGKGQYDELPSSLPGIYELAQVLGAEVDEKMFPNPQYQAFLREQMHAQLQRMPMAHTARVAWDRFEQQADRLLVQLIPMLDKHKLKTVTNPLQCRALAYRRDGVFIWPDWRDEAFVNIVASVNFNVYEDVRRCLTQWLAAENLSLNPRNGF